MFSRSIEGKEYTFGVSGKLWRNGLVMYDHQTDTLWSGVTGEALQGPLKGKRLEILAAQPKIRWRDWLSTYPNSRVLTFYGFQDLEEDNYADYHFSGMTGLFEPDHSRPDLPPKELVMGIQLDGEYRAYPLRLFKQTMILNDRVAGHDLVVYRDPESEASAVYLRKVDNRLLNFKTGPTWTLIEDTTTQSKWNIVTGQAVSGPLQGKSLQRIAHYNIYWFAWVDFYPKTSLYTPAKQPCAGK